MRDLGLWGPSRVKGRPALVRRLRALLVAAHRFGVRRAVSREDQQFAGLLADGLRRVLEDVERRDAC